MALAMREDNWTPADAAKQREWRKQMFTPKPMPKPDVLAVKIETAAQPPEAAPLEAQVKELSLRLEAALAELDAIKRRRAMEIEPISVDGCKFFLEDIIRLVAKYYCVSVMEIKSARRDHTVMRPRQVAMYLCKHHTIRSFPEIGRHLGGRDHSTILCGVRKIAARMLTDPTLCQEVAELEALVA